MRIQVCVALYESKKLFSRAIVGHLKFKFYERDNSQFRKENPAY